MADVDVPWLPPIEPAAGTTVGQIDSDPTKQRFPKWDFPVDHAVVANPVDALARVAGRLESSHSDRSNPTDSADAWDGRVPDWRADGRAVLESHREEGRLIPAVPSDALNAVVDESIVVEDVVTSRPALLATLELTEPGSYLSSGDAGLGWAGGEAVGVKLAHSENRVLSLPGDGSYVFSNPIAPALTAATHDAPARVVDTYASVVDSADDLFDELAAVVDALDAGQSAVLDVELDPA